MAKNTKNIIKLRQATGAGIMDCREALTSTKNDFTKALEYLQKKGLDKAAKKKGRKTGAGIIHAYIHSGAQVGVILHLACETDFVARTDDFTKLAHSLCMQIASMQPTDVKELLAQDYIREPDKKIQDLLDSLIAKVGENIKVEDFHRLAV